MDVLPEPNALETNAPVRDAWRRFVSYGELPVGAVRPSIEESWRRTSSSGLNPYDPNPSELAADQTRSLLRADSRLIEAAKPYMRAINRAAGDATHAAMLGDQEGYVLAVHGDPQSEDGPNRVPGPGALLAEGAAGTNGLATALAEGGPVTVRGPEHYLEGFQAFSCVGVPVVGLQSSSRGALCLATTEAPLIYGLETLVVCAGRAIEAELCADSLRITVFEVAHSGRERKAALLDELRSSMTRSQMESRARLETAAECIAGGQLVHGAQLLRAASAAVGRFSRRARLWRELALPTERGVQSINLRLQVNEVSQLLREELVAETPEIRLTVDPRIAVLAEPNHLRSALFAKLRRTAAVDSVDLPQVLVIGRARGDDRIEVLFARTGSGISDSQLVGALELPRGRTL